MKRIKKMTLDLPICKTSLTALSLNRCSPLWNSSDDPFAKHEYKRMSSSLSGKLQKAICSCNCSGTGGYTCSTSSNGIWLATHLAASSLRVETDLSVEAHLMKLLKANRVLTLKMFTYNVKIYNYEAMQSYGKAICIYQLLSLLYEFFGKICTKQNKNKIILFVF